MIERNAIEQLRFTTRIYHSDNGRRITITGTRTGQTQQLVAAPGIRINNYRLEGGSSLGAVDYKSTVVMQRLTFLLGNVRLNHLIGQITRTDCQVAPRPEMTPPEHPPQMRKLLQKYSRADPFQPLHNPANVYVRSVPHKNVNVVARYLPRQDRDFMLHRYLPNQVAHTQRHLTRQHLPAVLRNPNKMHFQIALRVRAQLVSFHATTLHDPILRLQGEGFPISPRGTLNREIVPFGNTALSNHYRVDVA